MISLRHSVDSGHFNGKNIITFFIGRYYSIGAQSEMYGREKLVLSTTKVYPPTLAWAGIRPCAACARPHVRPYYLIPFVRQPFDEFVHTRSATSTYPVESDRGKKTAAAAHCSWQSPTPAGAPRGSSLALGVLELVASGAALPQAVGRLIFLDLR